MKQSQNKYIKKFESFGFTPTETPAGGSLIYIVNHLWHKRPKWPKYLWKNELESTFIEIVNPRKLNIIEGVIYRHPSMDLADLVQVLNCHYLFVWEN